MHFTDWLIYFMMKLKVNYKSNYATNVELIMSSKNALFVESELNFYCCWFQVLLTMYIKCFALAIVNAVFN